MNGMLVLKIIGVPIMVYLLLMVFDQFLDFSSSFKVLIFTTTTLGSYWQVFYTNKKYNKK
ncbi:hypothetical protein [Pseudalkalibacillus hwajinpoensis]|uniref:hypothetical protein n=1 Tax=Guptibacillus hwajinpoensis TaxID=208199 RepID=UPI001A7EC291|nr:hypothetical protein [Pseudalkalibacillus hwajinpoensis]